MVILTLLILGLCFGSFINAFVWREYKKDELAERKDGSGTNPALADRPSPPVATSTANKHEAPTSEALSILRGRSMCSHCHHPLAAKDLVPVASYVWLRGKCRYCGHRIQDSPLAELLTPFLYVLSYLVWPFGFEGRGLVLLGFWLVFVLGFVALFLFDLRWRWMPFKIVYWLIALAAVQTLVLAVAYDQSAAPLVGAVAGALVIGGTFFALHRANDAWMGNGDWRLGIVLGILAGGASQAFLIIFLASVLGSMVAIPLLASKKAARNSQLPFGPFLIAATVAVVLFGGRLLAWYSQLAVV